MTMHINVNHPLLHASPTNCRPVLVAPEHLHAERLTNADLKPKSAAPVRSRATWTSAAIGRGDGRRLIREGIRGDSRNGWSPENPRPATQ